MAGVIFAWASCPESSSPDLPRELCTRIKLYDAAQIANLASTNFKDFANVKAFKQNVHQYGECQD
jgi:hypothetical protein